MGLNNLQLQDLVISNLYGKGILIDQTNEHKPDDTPKKYTENNPISTVEEPMQTSAIPYPVKGNNKQHILILYDYASAEIPAAETELLGKILLACGLTENDVAIVNSADIVDKTENKLLVNFSPKLIMLWGLQPSHAGFAFNIPLHKLQPIAGVTYFVTTSLKQMLENQEIKSDFWKNIRTYFNK